MTESRPNEKAQLKKQPSNNSHPAIYLSNLPHSIATVQIEDVFHEHAKVELAHVELLKKGHGSFAKTCGLGVVTLHDPELLDKVVHDMDGKMLMGRPMIVRKDRFVEDDINYGQATSA